MNKVSFQGFSLPDQDEKCPSMHSPSRSCGGEHRLPGRMGPNRSCSRVQSDLQTLEIGRWSTSLQKIAKQ
eukprot:2309159-Amphidinium_carterae.1